MVKKSLLLFAICLLWASFSPLHAQISYEEGYIVDLEGDTLRGDMVMSGNINYHDSVQFQIEDGTEQYLETYYPDDLTGFGQAYMGDYRSVLVMDPTVRKNRKIFLQEVRKGVLTLYSRKVFGEGVATYLYVAKNDGGALLLYGDSFQKQLEDLMADCPLDLVKPNINFSVFDIQKVVEKYNACADINNNRKDENLISFNKWLNGYLSPPTDEFMYNHSRVLPNNGVAITDKLNVVSMHVELKRKYRPAIRPGIAVHYMWGYRQAEYITGVYDFRNDYTSIGLAARLAYYIPGNGTWQPYGFIGYGVAIDRNDINYVQPDQPDEFLSNNYLIVPAGAGGRLNLKKWFIQFEVSFYRRHRTIGMGIGF